MRNTAEQVRKFIVESLGWDGSPAELTDDLPLIEKGILDSLGLLSLVTHLENSLGIQVDDGDIIPENLGTLRSIDQYVARKLDETRSQKAASAPM
ncbi:acyl carrier protein [Streptomyces sp. NPDC001709]